jgi:hypothetical protein
MTVSFQYGMSQTPSMSLLRSLASVPINRASMKYVRVRLRDRDSKESRRNHGPRTPPVWSRRKLVPRFDGSRRDRSSLTRAAVRAASEYQRLEKPNGVYRHQVEQHSDGGVPPSADHVAVGIPRKAQGWWTALQLVVLPKRRSLYYGIDILGCANPDAATLALLLARW